MNDNYTIVFQGLKLFRDAMLPFIVEKLQAAYGNRWWEQGVARCFMEKDIERLRAQFEKRHTLVVELPVDEPAEMLDINRFVNIIEGNWKPVFGKILDPKVEGWLHEVREVRNVIAHPQTGDLRTDDAWRCLDNAERILGAFNEEAADEVAAVKRSLLQMDKPYASLILVGEDAPHEQTFDLDRKRMVLGRDASTCDVVIPARFSRVSRRHALITWEVGGIFTEDLDSRNGTYVDGERVRGQRSLKDGQQITLGGPEPVASGKVCQLEFSLAPEAETTEEHTSASDSGVARPL